MTSDTVEGGGSPARWAQVGALGCDGGVGRVGGCEIGHIKWVLLI